MQNILANHLWQILIFTTPFHIHNFFLLYISLFHMLFRWWCCIGKRYGLFGLDCLVIVSCFCTIILFLLILCSIFPWHPLLEFLGKLMRINEIEHDVLQLAQTPSHLKWRIVVDSRQLGYETLHPIVQLATLVPVQAQQADLLGNFLDSLLDRLTLLGDGLCVFGEEAPLIVLFFVDRYNLGACCYRVNRVLDCRCRTTSLLCWFFLLFVERFTALRHDCVHRFLDQLCDIIDNRLE